MFRFPLPRVLAGLCLAVAVPAHAQNADAPKAGQQVAQSFETKVGLNYFLSLPKEYGTDKDKKWPLILFLHGSGERGSDLKVVAKHGPPMLVAQGKEMPFVVVSPQCPANEQWNAVILKKMLDDVMAKYSVDPDRVYLTGLSMGGYGTWDMAMAYPRTFAAIAPVCGGGNTGRARAIAKLPIWVFHGEDDPTVPIRLSEEMVDALKKAGATDVQFTRYPNTKHDSWVQAYNDPKLYEWFLSHKRQPAPAAAR